MALELSKVIEVIDKHRDTWAMSNSPFFMATEAGTVITGTYTAPCYAYLPTLYSRDKAISLVIPCNYRSTTRFTKERVLEFISFITGPESPWISYKDLLFPDAYDYQFRLNYGLIYDDVRLIPSSLLINFCKAFRAIGENPMVIERWIKLISLGISKREAYCLAYNLSEIRKDHWYPSFITHSCFNYSKIIEQYIRVSQARPDVHWLGPRPTGTFPFSNIDYMWDTQVACPQIARNLIQGLVSRENEKILRSSWYTLASKELLEILEGIHKALDQEEIANAA